MAMTTTGLMTAREAAAELDIQRSGIEPLMHRRALKRVDQGDGKVYVTRLSVLMYKDRRASGREVAKGKALSRDEKRAIVQILLLAGVISRRDIAISEGVRLNTAIKRASDGA